MELVQKSLSIQRSTVYLTGSQRANVTPTCRIATVDDRSAAYISSSLDDSLKYLIKGYVRLF